MEEAIRFLQAEYDDAERSFQIVELAEGYQILTRPEFAPYLERFDNVPRPSRLSGPALETLAIIAYRQPLGRIEIEYVRGVGLRRRAQDAAGPGAHRGRGPRRGARAPGAVRHHQRFLEHFGFKSLEELPRPGGASGDPAGAHPPRARRRRRRRRGAQARPRAEQLVLGGGRGRGGRGAGRGGPEDAQADASEDAGEAGARGGDVPDEADPPEA